MAAATRNELDVRDRLIEALGAVDRPGEVFTCGDRRMTMPGLEVEGLGSVLCLERDQNPERIALCARLSERAVEALEAFDERPQEPDWHVRHVDRSALLSSLVKAMVAIHAVKSLSRVIDHALASVDKYDLTDSHLAAIFTVESWLVKAAPNPDLALVGCVPPRAGKPYGSCPAKADQLPAAARAAMQL